MLFPIPKVAIQPCHRFYQQVYKHITHPSTKPLVREQYISNMTNSSDATTGDKRKPDNDDQARPEKAAKVDDKVQTTLDDAVTRQVISCSLLCPPRC